LKAGRFVYPGDPALIHPWAYVPDLAHAFVRVAEQRDRLQGHHRFHFAGHAVTGEQMREAVEAVAGRPLRTVGMPWGLIRLGSPLVPMWREVVRMGHLWQRPHQLDDATLRSLIGTLPHTPLKQAVAQAWRDLQPAADQSAAASFSANARA